MVLLDGATVEQNFLRFIERVIQNETVFYLGNENGAANSVSNEDKDITILMFWSDLSYARRARKCFQEDFEEQKIDLFDFLYKWLPGMSGDGVLAGPNWTGNLVGKEIDPFELREQIEQKMPDELLEKYEAIYTELTSGAL